MNRTARLKSASRVRLSKAAQFLESVRYYSAKAITLGDLSWRQLIVRIWKRVLQDDILGRSAQLSYYFLLAMFPLLIFVSTLVGYFFSSERHAYFHLIDYLDRVMPQSAFDLVRAALKEMREQTGTGQLTFGFILSVWVASSGMEAIIEGLNVAYAVHEARPWWRRRVVAIALTISLGAFVAIVLFLIVASTSMAASLGRYVPVLERIGRISAVSQWTAGILFLLLALTLIFRFAPNIPHERWEANLPGAVLSLVCWIVASLGLKFYMSEFGTFSRAYGPLGALIVLMIWLYVSGAAILIGGELNSVIWHAVRSKSESESQFRSRAKSD